jgi:hypothetical protein
MTMIDETSLAECRELALRVAPELSGQPLYLVDTQELAGLPCGDNCMGFAAIDSFMDRNIADRLGERYIGAGPVIGLDGERIKAAAEPGAFEPCLRSVVVHEVAHCYPVKKISEPRDTPLTRAIQHKAMRQSWAAPRPEPIADTTHDLNFMRRAMHLYGRAVRAGYQLPLAGLVGTFLHQSREEFYLAALLRELLEMRDAQMHEIEATSPPREFLDLWEGDVGNYKFFRERNVCPA